MLVIIFNQNLLLRSSFSTTQNTTIATKQKQKHVTLLKISILKKYHNSQCKQKVFLKMEAQHYFTEINLSND